MPETPDRPEIGCWPCLFNRSRGANDPTDSYGEVERGVSVQSSPVCTSENGASYDS